MHLAAIDTVYPNKRDIKTKFIVFIGEIKRNQNIFQAFQFHMQVLNL